MDLCALPAHELTRRLTAGEVTAVQIVEDTLRRIDAVEGRAPSTAPYQPQAGDDATVHAYISLQRERTLEQARAVDAQIARGEPVGPLAGVPLSVKDIFCVEGTRSTAASKMLADYVAPYTATPAGPTRTPRPRPSQTPSGPPTPGPSPTTCFEC